MVYLSLMRLALWNNPIHEVGVTVYGEIINNLRFADDIDLIAVNMKIDSLNTEEHPQQLATTAHNSSQIPGLKINVVKTKTMAIIKQNVSVNIKLGNEQMEQVNNFVYLGATITVDASCDKDIQRRISKVKVKAVDLHIASTRSVSYGAQV